MNAILTVLTIFFTLSTVSLYRIAGQSVSNKGAIIGPKTPVYYLRYPRPNYLKVERVINLFEASPAYKYYHGTNNHDSSTFFVCIFVIVDYTLYESWNEKDIIENIVAYWNQVDEYFAKLNHTKVKLFISGVAIPERPFTNITKSYLSECIESNCLSYDAQPMLKDMTAWLLDELDGFEQLYFDLFLFMSAIPLTLMENPQEPCNIIFSSGTTNSICQDKDPFGILVYTHPLLENYPDEIPSLRAAQSIGFGILMHNPDEAIGCEKNHIMNMNMSSKTMLTWSECSERAFINKSRDSNNDCLKTLPLYTDNDYDDE